MRRWAAIACVALSACATLDRIPALGPDLQAVAEHSYVLGTEQTANLGERLLRTRDYRLSIAPATRVRADRDFTLSGGLDRIHFKEGETLAIVGRRRAADGGTLLILDKDGTFLLQVRGDGRIDRRILTDLGFGVRTPMLASFRARPAIARLVPVRPRVIEEKSFGDNYDLLFSGADDRSLHLTLREFWRDDLDRPALQQTLSFPLNTGPIRFRHLTIAVKAVTPERITYVIERDGVR